MVMRILETLVCYDQVQVGELAGIEILMRKAQLTEIKHKDRIIKFSKDDPNVDGEHLHCGTGTTRGLEIACHALDEFVSGELHKEAAMSNEKRKLREECGLARPPPGKP